MAIMLQRKPEALTAWHFVEEFDESLGRVATVQERMFEALSTLQPQGWRGAVGMSEDGSLRLELNRDDGVVRHLVAVPGDWIVLDFNPRKLTNEECEGDYDAAAVD